MTRGKLRLPFLVVMLLTPPWANTDVPRPDLPTLAVIGVTAQVNDARWQDPRIGIGLRELMIDRLDGMARFNIPVPYSDIGRQSRICARQAWQAGAVDFDEFLPMFKNYGADYAAFAHVELDATPEQVLNVGGATIDEIRTSISVEITLIDLNTGMRVTTTGKGEDLSHARSAVFVFRNDTVLFQQSSVGKATAQAVNRALALLEQSLLKAWVLG
ncbi:MAG: hypothetical protein QNK37_12085 [Acidobacteriota bacterium]|nr:hypothetical protein [Acidobacteriota bacterium]